MVKRIAWLPIVAWLLGGPAYAQDKVELTGDYSYFRVNPGLPSYFNSFNLNGGGGDGSFFFTKMLGFKADLQGYGSTTHCTKPGSAFTGCASGNLFTYLFGPEFKFRPSKFEPFAEVLLGGAHTNFYGNACTEVGICGSKAPSNNAFAFEVGGGLDVDVNPKFAIRLVDADFVLTRFGNNFTIPAVEATAGNNSQSNFRFQTGVQFRF